MSITSRFRGFKFFQILLFVFYAVLSFASEYDAGPDLSTPEGQIFAEHFAKIPNCRALGMELCPGGKFRYAFGPTFFRGRLTNVKVLVIGQDPTHIAEAAGRTFTGGTGGRMQHVLNYLGVRESGLYINSFAYTIKGQYADFAPVLIGTGENQKLSWKQFLSRESFHLAQDLNNPLVQWRNDLLEHIIEANKNSLKLIIVVGGAARDTLATFIRSRGGNVPTLIKPKDANKYEMVAYKSVHAGGNRSFFYPVDSRGQNILINDGERPRYASAQIQKELIDRANYPERLAKLVKISSGPYQNGIYDLAQFGYNLNKAEIGEFDQSLKGLHLSTGALESDIRFIILPHPGAAGAAANEEERDEKVRDLQEKFQSKLNKLKDFAEDGWSIPSDSGLESLLFANQEFKYGKKPIPFFDFPFGKSQILIDHESSARREGANIIEFGGRNAGKYAETDVERALRAKAVNGYHLAPIDVPWEPLRSRWTTYDRGPGEFWSKAMLDGLDLEAVYKTKRGKTLKKDGVDALYVKNHPRHGYFGIYRGIFENPEIFVLADPKDLDDLYTARALTGYYGQKLHGFLQGLDVGDQYLILKTVPFDMTGASSSDWKRTLSVTRSWRQNLIATILKESKPKLILTYGSHADSEMDAINTGSTPVISLTDGFSEAFKEINQLSFWQHRPLQFVEEPWALPRTHLPFGMQSWVGSYGSRVIRERGKAAGIQYQIIVPKEVTQSSGPGLNNQEQKFIDSICAEKLRKSSSG